MQDDSSRFPDIRTFRILIVENHGDSLDFLSAYLESLGHRLFTATDCNGAREVLAGEPVDILLCDIKLPGEDGWSLLESLGGKRPPFCIAMSGYASEADRKRSAAAGFVHHLAKPFLPSDLDAALAMADRSI